MMRKAGNSFFTSRKLEYGWGEAGREVNIRTEDYVMLLNDMMATD